MKHARAGVRFRSTRNPDPGDRPNADPPFLPHPCRSTSRARAATMARAAEPTVFQRDGLALGGTDPSPISPKAPRCRAMQPSLPTGWARAGPSPRRHNRDAFLAEPERYAPASVATAPSPRRAAMSRRPSPRPGASTRTALSQRQPARAGAGLAELPTVIARAEANWPGILG
jgi:hypothetical protein